MPPKKKKTPARLKQTTLINLTTLSPKRTRSTQALSSHPGKQNNANDSSSEDIGALKFEAKVSTGSDPETADNLNFGGVRRKRLSRVVSDSDSEHDSGQDPASNSSAKPSSRRRREVKEGNGGNIGEDDKPSKRRRLLKGRRAQTSPAEEDEDERIDEVDDKYIVENRFRARDKKTAFQRNLERLQLRKRGQVSPSASSHDEEESDKERPFAGAKPHIDHGSPSQLSSDSENSSDFIVEDDGMAMPQLPTEFSMESHQDLSHQFKKIFQFFVHIAVQSPQDRRSFMAKQLRDEEYFSVPLQVLRRKILGLRDSLVASSVWRPDFKKALEKFPNLDIVPLEFSVPYCDACHLGRRTSTLLGRLSGNPCERSGFNDKDDTESEETLEFHLGRFCAKRTRIFHEFSHWENALFLCVCREIEELRGASQTRGFYRVAYMGGKQPPDDLGDADGICEWLDERQLIEIEWEKIKTLMESARHLEMSARKGENVE